ncbi:MAG TPA: GntR family transcriptional regulator [Streptosporangiaceae bacterium]|nr:GntR family transcriptional regulator [Streptosporangiaceae bacterium]
MALAVDRESSVPPYQQIAAQLRAAILDGTYPPGSRLPGVTVITAESGVANLTARKALRVLVRDGHARMVAGMGTYVTGERERG